MILQGLPPIGAPSPAILILGSFPSAASLGKGEYYGFGRNHFWELVSKALGEGLPEGYGAKKEMLERAGIALWDVLASCEREGSLDAAIRGEAANPVADFVLARPSIARIALNGSKAAAAFFRHVAPAAALRPAPNGGPARRSRPRSGPPAIGETAEWRPGPDPARSILVARLPSTSPIPTSRYRSAADKEAAWRGFLAPAPDEIPLHKN